MSKKRTLAHYRGLLAAAQDQASLAGRHRKGGCGLSLVAFAGGLAVLVAAAAYALERML